MAQEVPESIGAWVGTGYNPNPPGPVASDVLTTKPMDDGFKSINSKLLTNNSPFNVWTGNGTRLDSAWYVAVPGVNFMRPWLGIPNGAAFQWPLGLEGFSMVVDPTLGIHKYIGDNDAVVEVLHAGEEHFTLTGNFFGFSAPDMIKALRTVVKAKGPEPGKVLWLPGVVEYAQRVHVVHAEFGRDIDSRGFDATYSIEFVRTGHTNLALDPAVVPTVTTPTAGKGTHFVKVDAVHNTLRKIAKWRLNSATKWRRIYDANRPWFIRHSIPLHKAPDYRLPLGLKLTY